MFSPDLLIIAVPGALLGVGYLFGTVDVASMTWTTIVGWILGFAAVGTVVLLTIERWLPGRKATLTEEEPEPLPSMTGLDRFLFEQEYNSKQDERNNNRLVAALLRNRIKEAWVKLRAPDNPGWIEYEIRLTGNLVNIKEIQDAGVGDDKPADVLDYMASALVDDEVEIVELGVTKRLPEGAPQDGELTTIPKEAEVRAEALKFPSAKEKA